MHHLGEVVQCAACAVRTYSVYEPETLFFINMTEERLQSCMCQVRGMMVTVLGMVTVCGLEEWSRCVLEAEAVAAASAAFMNDFMAFFMALTFPPARAAR